MDEKALEALHVAATAIKQVSGISDVSADNDGKSGELFFTVESSGVQYCMSLRGVFSPGPGAG